MTITYNMITKPCVDYYLQHDYQALMTFTYNKITKPC